ncbi:MAG TPA: hypothetical protein DEO85_01945 [Maritimibacter sp.]|nr:hypothetical protein [Maritimibacter sp.]
MTKQDLAATTAALLDEISVDPMDWRAYTERLEMVIIAHERLGEKLPGALKVYADWLDEEQSEARYENMPV